MLRHPSKLILRTTTLRTSIMITPMILGVILFAVKGQTAGVKPVATPAPATALHTLVTTPNVSPTPLSRYPQLGGDFTLTNTEEQPQSFNSLKGFIVLLTFGFTTCTNTCPMILAKLARLRSELSAEDQKKVRLVFINVDSKVSLTDFKKYLSVFEPKDATEAGIVGFTGTPEALQTVAKQYGATFFENNTVSLQNSHAGLENNQTGMATVKNADAITHTDRIFLIDATQTIRRIYSKEVAAKEVIEDLQTLIQTNF